MEFLALWKTFENPLKNSWKLFLLIWCNFLHNWIIFIHKYLEDWISSPKFLMFIHYYQYKIIHQSFFILLQRYAWEGGDAWIGTAVFWDLDLLLFCLLFFNNFIFNLIKQSRTIGELCLKYICDKRGRTWFRVTMK